MEATCRIVHKGRFKHCFYSFSWGVMSGMRSVIIQSHAHAILTSPKEWCRCCCSFFFSFIFISWRLITLQHCSGFCHTLKWISHGFTCIPHPGPLSHLPLHLIPFFSSQISNPLITSALCGSSKFHSVFCWVDMPLSCQSLHAKICGDI